MEISYQLWCKLISENHYAYRGVAEGTTPEEALENSSYSIYPNQHWLVTPIVDPDTDPFSSLTEGPAFNAYHIDIVEPEPSGYDAVRK